MPGGIVLRRIVMDGMNITAEIAAHTLQNVDVGSMMGLADGHPADGIQRLAEDGLCIAMEGYQ